MSLIDLYKAGKLKNHTTSEKEIEGLRKIVNRDIDDASIEALSDDRRFATAYNAVLQLSTMTIACTGYRVKSGAGHHLKTFEAVKSAIGTKEAENLANYFDLCRRKRNNIDYDSAEIVSESESNELLEKAQEFQTIIEKWIADNYPTYQISK